MVQKIDEITDRVNQASGFIPPLLHELDQVMVGQKYLTERLVLGLLTGEHILLEGVPGLAKTTAVKTLAQSVRADFKRIQFTPDLLPADLLGTQIYQPKTGEFDIKKGPLFANIILADEINRAPAKVQSALLEAMQERQITIAGNTFPLGDPFMVIATQNPIEQEGTYPLPEAQIDRFMLKVVVDYPNLEEEQKIMNMNLSTSKDIIKPVVTTKQITSAQEIVNDVYMDEKIEKYILDLIFCTRYPEKYNLKNLSPLISFGASPRGSINLALASKCYAFIKHRGFVIPEDVREVVTDVLRHRIGLTYEAEAENVSTEDIIKQIVNTVEVP